MGRKAEARKALAKLEQQSRQSYVSPLWIAGIYAVLGERDRAYEWLEKVYQERGKMLQALTLDWRFNSLHSDPRFINLRRRIGLPQTSWRID